MSDSLALFMELKEHHPKVVAVLLGVGFGWALVRAGLSQPHKIAGQFYWTDLTVFKVMFTAIITAMQGIFWLEFAGWIERGEIYVPDTFLAPQLLGGLIFGIGMVASGLCPGTACAAAASGCRQGWITAGGVFSGVFLAGLSSDCWRGFYESTAYGPFTLTQWLQWPPGVVVGALTLLALAAMVAAQAIEQRRA